MSVLLSRVLFASLCLFGIWATLKPTETPSWSLSSPNKSCKIELRLSKEGALVYQVKRAGKVVLQDSPLGLVMRDNQFNTGLRLIHAGKVTSQRERYELFAGIAPQVDRLMKRRSIEFQKQSGEKFTVDLAATDQGVAFRYRFDSSSKGPCELSEEQTGFHLPPDARGWMQPYHAAGKYTPAYEDFYFNVAPGAAPPHSRDKPIGWCFPALFHVPSAESWLLISEVTGEDPYPACHLGADSSGGVFRIAFPRQNERDIHESDDVSAKTNDKPDLPQHTLPWTMPWRVIAVGNDAGKISTSTLITDLAPPSKVADTSWIKPGRASWAWWSFPEGPHEAATFNLSTDLSAEMGWEYTLFDANWWDPGLPPIVRHATSRKIAPMIWTHARDFDGRDKRLRKLDEIAAEGAVGLKADFWCSDRQQTIETIQSLFEDAAKRKLLVNLHGCTLPRGWHRTWPNFMTAEAVLGAESYLYESQYSDKAAELNTVLPFTRNVMGPMDYTPVAFSPKRYHRNTTAAHELATAIIFTSGIIHYAEGPDALRKLPPDALRILRDAPARWDETRCLIGEPGRLAVFARRAGTSWFITGISGSNEPRSLTLDLTDYSALPQRTLILEGENAHQTVSASKPAAASAWHHTVPPRGGFILRLDP